VRLNRAQYGSDAHGRYIEFIGIDGAAERAMEAVDRSVSELGYDLTSSEGLARLNAIRRLPIADDPLRLLMIMSKETKAKLAAA
jgi:hypothetical protein